MPVIEGFTERSARGAGGAIEGFRPTIISDLKPPSGSRSALGFANDTIVTGVNTALGIGKAISDFVSVDNPVSRGLQYLIDEGEQTYTPQTRAAREELSRAIDAGGWDAARGVGEFVLTSPVQAAAMAAGNFGPFGTVIKGARGLAALGGAGTAGVRTAGIGAASAMGGAAAGGDAAGDAYAQVMRSPNVDPAVREQLARQAAREASVVPAIIGAATPFLPGSAESQLARGLGITRASIPRAAASEFGQEFIEEGATKLSANLAARQYDPSIDPTRGALGSALLGGVLGAGTGAGVTYINNRAVEADLLRMDQARAAQREEQQRLRDAQLAPILGMIRPDSGVGPQALIDQQLGISPALSDKEIERQRKQREADIIAAFDAPSGVRVPGEGGVERELTSYERMLQEQGLTPQQVVPGAAPPAAPSKVFSPEEQELISMGVAPNGKALELLSEIKASGLPMDSLAPVVTAMAERKNGQAKKLLAQAIIESRKPAPAAAAPTAPVVVAPVAPPVGSTAASVTEAPGVTSLPVPEAPANVQASQAQQAEAPGEAPLAAAPAQGAPAADAAPGVAPTAPVVQRKVRRVVDPAALQQAQAFVAPEAAEEQAAPADPNVAAWEDSKPDDAPALTALTPALQQVWAEAVAAKGEGRRVNLFKIAEDIVAEQGDETTGDDTLATLNQIFGERDAAMLYDRYVDNLTEEAIANKYGQSRQNVAKVTGEGALGQKTRATKIRNAQQKFGWSDEYVQQLAARLSPAQAEVEAAPTSGRTGVDLEATESAFGADTAPEMGGRDPSLREAGFSTSASLGGSVSNWRDTGELAGRTNITQADQAKLDELYARRAAAEEAGNDSEVESADAEISQVETKYLSPSEVAAKFTQQANDLREKSLKRRQQIEQARAAGKDTVSVNNKLVPVAELEAQEAELQQKAQEALDRAEGVLQRGAVRKAKGAERKKPVAVAAAAGPLSEEAKAASAKFKAAKLDLAAMDDSELPALREAAARFRNTELVAKIDRRMGVEPSADTVAAPTVSRVKKDEAKAPAAPAAQQTAVLTPAEQAARAWDQATSTIPGAPKWADLTPVQQREFVGYGENNWTRQDVVTMLQRAAPAPAAQLPESTNFLERGKFVYHAVRNDEDIQGIVDNGLRLGANVSFGTDGQAFSGEGDTILVFRREDVAPNRKGYQNDGTATKAAKPVAVLKDTQLEAGRSTVDELESQAADAQDEFNRLAEYARREYGLSEADVSAYAQGTKKVKDAPADAQPTLTRLRALSNRIDRLVNESLGAPEVAESPAQVLDRYRRFNLPVRQVTIEPNDDGQNVSLAPAQDLDARDSAGSTSQRERDLRAKSRDTEQPGDVMLATTGKFVSFDDALEAARAAVASGALRPDAPFQYNAVLDIAPRDWNRMVQAMTGPRAMRSPGVTSLDADGKRFTSQPVTLDSLLANDGVARAVRHMTANGVGEAINAVQAWYVTNDSVNWDAIFAEIDGKPSVVFSADALQDRARTVISFAHEVGHAVDETHTGNFTFSGEPELNLSLGRSGVRPMGAVAIELLDHYENGDSALSQLLGYPLDMEGESGKSAARIREELFAQLWAFSSLADGMQFLRDNLPASAAFMESVHAQARQTYATGQAGADQGAQPGQVQGGRQAAGDAGARASRQTQAGVSRLPAELQKPVGTITNVLRDTKNAALNLLTFTEDVINRAVDLGVTSAARLRSIYQERAALTGKLEREVERVADLYNRVPERERGTGPQSVNQFLYDATREGKWGFKPSWRTGASAKVTLDPDMVRRYGALSKESKALVEAIFRHGDEVLSLKKQTVIDATNSEYDALIAAAKKAGDAKKAASLTADKADQLKRFDSLFALQEFRPYAPLRRFGDYVVIARSQKYLDADEKTQRQLEKSEDHYHVSFAESAAAARELVDQLNKQGAFAEVVFRQKEAVQQSMFGGTLTAFNKLRSELDSELADAAPGEKAAIRAARKVVGELYLSTLAENSARKSEMRRRGVAGEIDVLRSFTTQGRADARFIAGAKYNGQTLEAFNAMRREVKTGGAEEQNTKSGVFNELMKRHTQSLDYDPTPIASKLARLSTIWYLATSPAYYLQNMTQPFMLSMPVMAGRHNYLKVAGALVKAYTDLGPMFRNAKLGEQFNFNAAPPDVRAAISTLVDRGRIDIGMDTDLGDFQLEGKGPVKDRWNKIDRGIRNAAQKLEAVNRLSTAIAAYRMELAKTGDAAKALEYAESIISQTHGDYTALNAPRAFNTPTGKVALQFRKFQLIQLTLLTKLVNNTFRGDDRKAAFKALSFTLGHTAVMAGAIGLPGFAAIAWALGMMGGDDEPFNAEKELREFIGDPQLATLLTRGVPAALGVDLSSKLGMGNTLSLLPFNDLDLSSRSGVESAAFALFGGPAGGLTLRAADGMSLIRDGQYYRGLEQLMPTGVTNAMRAYRTADEGVTRRNGDVLISPDEISGMQTFWQAIGFQPTQLAERQFFDKVVRDTDRTFQTRADRIRNAYLRAGDDYDARAEARERWMELQDAREAAGYRRQPLSSLIRAEQSQNQRERNTVDGVQFNRDNRSFVQELIAAEED